MRKIIALVFVLACCLTLVSAQQSAQQTKPAAANKWDIFTGYSHERAYAINIPPFH